MEQSVISAIECDQLRELALRCKPNGAKCFHSVKLSEHDFALGAVYNTSEGELLSLTRVKYSKAKDGDPNFTEEDSFTISREAPGSDGRLITAERKEIFPSRDNPYGIWLVDYKMTGTLEVEVFREMLRAYQSAITEGSRAESI